MAFPALLIDSNLFGGQLYHSSNFKRLEVPFLQKFKINKKLIEFMNKEEKLKALEVLDELLSEEDENFDENDSQLPTKNIQMSGNGIYSAQERI